ncbi:hypothetical protein STCU_01397 [Strigomonas culicis]|uniref:Uncharacterized protein n=1 Tax=Strigomonas culicis TaxID=28005 RepID=S9VPS4_9TRYP|nr:hypothetical protein STCU_04747 [Strigomonas culicis]EPY34705.1 hypothetical protein STCU_01397 [Strigomonas culicis]|eukprot:EPY29056.1 hypothetical protein STCU_04747 [Strigomonas culicis]
MGLGTKACMCFCYLNAITAFVIAYCFDLGIKSMAIVSVENGWDCAQKGKACRRASIMYLVLAVVLTIRGIQLDRQEPAGREERVSAYLSWMEVEGAGRESEPLLPLSSQPNYGSNM